MQDEKVEVKPEVTVETVVTPEVPVVEAKKESKPESKVDSIKRTVDERVKQQAPSDILNSIVDMMYEEKKKNVQALVLEGLKKREALDKKIKETKPNDVRYSGSGERIESFTKDKYDELQKLKKELKDLSDALENFLGKGEVGPLEKAVKSQGGQENQNQGKDSKKPE